MVSLRRGSSGLWRGMGGLNPVSTRAAFPALRTCGFAGIVLFALILGTGEAGAQTASDMDVNRDGAVTSMDALLIINYVNRHGALEVSKGAPRHFDVNRDGWVSSLDALVIINYLNRQGSGPVKKKEQAQVISIASLRGDIRTKSIQVEKVITAKQKDKLRAICRDLEKASGLRGADANHVKAVRDSVAASFKQATPEQVDFLSVYVLNLMYAEGRWSLPQAVDKTQALIQVLSNVSKVLNDESGTSNIRKLG
jgi:hypothetical protein